MEPRNRVVRLEELAGGRSRRFGIDGFHAREEPVESRVITERLEPVVVGQVIPVLVAQGHVLLESSKCGIDVPTERMGAGKVVVGLRALRRCTRGLRTGFQSLVQTMELNQSIAR